jgi:hypothetical protein
MTVKHIHDPKTPIGEILKAAAADGVVLESPGQTRYVVLPLNDDLIDYLIEQDPRFIDECEQIRQRMLAGRSQTHEEVKMTLADDPGPSEQP